MVTEDHYTLWMKESGEMEESEYLLPTQFSSGLFKYTITKQHRVHLCCCVVSTASLEVNVFLFCFFKQKNLSQSFLEVALFVDLEARLLLKSDKPNIIKRGHGRPLNCQTVNEHD